MKQSILFAIFIFLLMGNAEAKSLSNADIEAICGAANEKDRASCFEQAHACKFSKNFNDCMKRPVISQSSPEASCENAEGCTTAEEKSDPVPTAQADGEEDNS